MLAPYVWALPEYSGSQDARLAPRHAELPNRLTRSKRQVAEEEILRFAQHDERGHMPT